MAGKYLRATLTAAASLRRGSRWAKCSPAATGRHRVPWSHLFSALALLWATTGCTPTTWLARRLQQAPNSFPRALGPKPLVYYSFPERWLTNFPVRTAEVGPPAATLSYRLVEPANYGFNLQRSQQLDGQRLRYQFDFLATVPGPTNAFTAAPRGTLFLLHGYGVDSTTLLQWALTLAGDGWRCVLVDLRGHGGSTGRKVLFGAGESHDLAQLATELDRRGELVPPVAVLGASYGAALALKWAGEDPRLTPVIALTPYAELQPAILALRDRYARWLPRGWVRAAAARLPRLVSVEPGGLDPLRWLTKRPVRALFIATDHDPIAPPAAVQRLHAAAPAGSGYFRLTNGIHETAPFEFTELLPAVRAWLTPAGVGTEGAGGTP